MLYLLTDIDTAQQLYPQCFGPGVDVSRVSVAVHASMKETTLNGASAFRVTTGMALWIALTIHIVGVEIYVSFPCNRGSVPILTLTVLRFDKLNLSTIIVPDMS